MAALDAKALDTSRPREPGHRLKAFLVEAGHAEGFDAIRIVAPDVLAQAQARLDRYLAEGRHGTMAWMEETAARRGDPRTLWPEVRSIVMLAMNYGPEDDPLAQLSVKSGGAISVYARHRDYHDVVKGRLKAVAGRFAARAGADVKVFVDTAPVMEKPLAEKAGLGWQGKHTNLVSRRFGSWLFLGSIFTTAHLPFDAPEADHCGSCRACLDVCPTDAFPAPYQLDARRCISYLTIEHKGPIPATLRQAIGNRIYGCDDCLAVCPWNKFARTAHEAKLVARADLKTPPLDRLLQLDDGSFRAFFSGSPVKRIGRDRFLRNVLIAAGNSGDLRLVDPVRCLLDDAAPIVRGMAVWALARLAPQILTALAPDHAGGETDRDVMAEWQAAMRVHP